MLGDSGTIAEVAVEVYGDLSRLEADFDKGRRASEKFDRDVATGRREGAAAFRELEREAGKNVKTLEELARAYKPLDAAALRYIRDLEKIDRLQRQAFLTQREANEYTALATQRYNEAAQGTKEMATWSEKAAGKVRLLASTAVLAAGAGFLVMAKAAISNAAALKDQADQLGISASELQRWHYVASQTGVAASEMDRGIEELSESMGKAAAGSERQAKAFELLGISLKNADGSAKSAAQAMPQVADALLRIEDANQRAAVAQVLFGDAAADIAPALAGGSAKINELSDAADRLGIVLSDEEIQKLDDTNRKLEDMKTVLSARVAGVVAENADSILSLADALATLADLAAKAAGAYVSFWATVGQYAGRGIAAGAEVGGPAGGPFRAIRSFFAPERGDGRSRPSAAGQAEIQAALSPAGGGAIDASAFLAPKGRGGRRTRDPHNERAFENQLASLQTQLLRSIASQATNAETRTALELAILDIERERFQDTLAIDVAKKKFTAAEAELLSTKFMELDAAKRNVLDVELQEQMRKERLELQSSSLDNDRELLDIQRDLARSNRERREIDLDLLGLQHRMETAQLEAVIASTQSSDIEKQIARERMQHLEALRGLQEQVILRETQGPVADFFDSVTMSADELDDAMQRIRAARLEDMRERAVAFADDVGSAFGQVGRDILALKSPFEILQNLLFSLTETFTEEVLIRPLEDFARQSIGGPLAEMAVGAPAGPEGLWIEQLGGSSLKASFAVDQLALAATQASQAMAAAQLAGGGGGGGGILGSVLGIASNAFTPGGQFTPGLMADVASNIAANPGIFHDGGEVGPGGMPIRRRPGEVDIRAQVGEYYMPKGPTRMFRRELDMIRMGRTPDFGGRAAAMASGGNTTVQIGDLVFPNATDERSVRRAGRQAASDIGGRVARAAKTGIVKNDR